MDSRLRHLLGHHQSPHRGGRAGARCGMTGARAETLWTIDDVATYLRVPVQTLYQWRRKKIGPPARKCGRHLRYEPAAVRQWFTNGAT
ncbi:MAG: helix-turn-helix domain-containing protein [Pseudonocardiaceae bacterium]